MNTCVLLLASLLCVCYGATSYCIDESVNPKDYFNSLYVATYNPVDPHTLFMARVWNTTFFNMTDKSMKLEQTFYDNYIVAAEWIDGDWLLASTIVGLGEQQNTSLVFIRRSNLSHYVTTWYPRFVDAVDGFIDWVSMIAIDSKKKLAYTLTPKSLSLAVHNISDVMNPFVVSTSVITAVGAFRQSQMIYNGIDSLIISSVGVWKYHIPTAGLKELIVSGATGRVIAGDIVVSPDGQYLLSADPSSNQVEIWNITDGSHVSSTVGTNIARPITLAEQKIITFSIDSKNSVVQHEINLKVPTVPTYISKLVEGDPLPNKTLSWIGMFTNALQDQVFIGFKGLVGFNSLDYISMAWACGNFSEEPKIVISISEDISNSENQDDSPEIIAGSIVGFLVVVMAIFGFVYFYFLRNRNLKYFLREEENEISLKSPDPFSKWKIHFEEIEISTEALGRGNFGIVQKARWRGADVVVKSLHNMEQDQVKTFLKEATHMIELRRHPNVCQFLGIVYEPERLMIVTEFMSEGSLWDMIHRGAIDMTFELLIKLATDAALGMSHIHMENILHCDLAARNLLVRRNGEILTLKISDFGMAHQSQSEAYSTTAENPLPVRWASPELLNTHIYTKSSDVWAFGVTLWEMAEQKRPYFLIPSNQSVFEFVTGGGRLTRPCYFQVENEFWELMQSCWRIPEERPSFLELAAQLSKMRTDGNSDESSDSEQIESPYYEAQFLPTYDKTPAYT